MHRIAVLFLATFTQDCRQMQASLRIGGATGTVSLSGSPAEGIPCLRKLQINFV
jgi:hypothetical protein